jgi:hypothetical protein
MNLAYDRGLMLTFGTDFGTDVILEAVNGCGLTEADANKLFDIDDHKTFVGRISQDITDFFRIGVFALSGKEDMTNDAARLVTNSVLAYGPDATIGLGDMFELNLQYVLREDSELFVSSSDNDPIKDTKTNGAMAELIFTPDGDKSEWYAAGIFNWIDSDIESLIYKTTTLHLGYLVNRNIRLVGEATYNFSDANNTFPFFSIGFVTAF